MYKKGWYTCKVVVLLIKPIVFWTFSLPSASLNLQVTIDEQRERWRLGRQDWKAKFSSNFDETFQLDTTKFETLVSTPVLLCYWVRPVKERKDVLPLVIFDVQDVQLFAKFAIFVKFAIFIKSATLQGAPFDISFAFSPTLWQMTTFFAIFVNSQLYK